MATVLENAQFMDDRFAGLRQSAGRYLDAQVQMAQREAQERKQRELMNLKRLQELEDQKTEAALRTSLTNLTVEGQKDIEKSRATRDDARWTAAQAREDTKAAEAQTKATIANVRAAFAAYKAAGGEKKITDFGREDDTNTLYAIQDGVREVEKDIQSRRFAGFADNLKMREREIAALAEPDENEMKAITQDAVAFVTADATQADAAKYYNRLAEKLEPEAALIAARQKYPAFAAAVDAQVQGRKSAIRAEKAKSPEFVRNLQGLLADRQIVTKAAMDSPYGDAFFNALKPAVAEDPKTKTANLGALTTGKPTAQAAGRASAGSDAPAALSPAAIVRDQGVAGALMALVNPTNAPLTALRQLGVDGVAAPVAAVDRGVSSALASLYNLRPVSMDKGYLTRAGEATGDAAVGAYDQLRNLLVAR